MSKSFQKDKIKYYCCFIGWGRSGNSLVGALLNFHPNIYIKNEFMTVRDDCKTEEEIIDLLLNKIHRREKIKGKIQNWGGFQHKQFNIKRDIPLVVGGKKGGRTSNDMIESPELFDNIFNNIIKLPVKWIHVQRNPYDNISSFVKVSKDDAIDMYFKHAQSVQKVLSEREYITIHVEDLCKNTESVMKRLCEYYEVPIVNGYLKHCREVVWNNSRITRHNVKWWNKERIDRVKKLMKQYDFMRGYSYEEKYNSLWW